MNNDEKLIELVKAHRAIYDKTDVFYSNKDYVKELWQEIAKEMNQTVPVCQKRWRYLRDYFVRQLHMTQNHNIQQNGTTLSMITSPVSDSSSVTTIITTATTTTTPASVVAAPITTANNNNNNNNSNNGTQKKKTFWAFYDKMLFLKPFSSTRKVKPKSGSGGGMNRRQSQGYFNKSLISAQSPSENDQITVHTVSDSNSADDEFDSFEYMTMYQMQFGTEADKAELQCNGVYRVGDSTDELQQQQQQQQHQSQPQQQLQLASQQVENSNNKLKNNDMTTTTTATTTAVAASFKDTQQQQNQYQEPIKIIYKSNSSSSNNNTPPIEYAQNSTNSNNTAIGVASTSTSMAKTMRQQKQQQQQQQSRKMPYFSATTATSSSRGATSSVSPPIHLRPSTSSSSTAKKRKRSEICEEILDILKKSESDDMERNDEHAMFFKSLLNSVRKIDEEHILAFRTEIIQIIMKYHFMSQQNDKNGTNSDVVVVDTGEMHWRHKLPC